MKLKCEQFLLLLDKKTSEVNSQQQQRHVTLQQHHNQTVNNHIALLNLKTTDESSKQPDVVCRNLAGTNWGSLTMVGEVKGEDQKEDKRVCLLDLIRIGCISAAEIKDALLEGVIGVHVVGLQMTFYITSLVADHIYAMTEICSFAIPRDQSELRYYTLHIDDIYNVLQYSQKCVPAVEKEEFEEESYCSLKHSRIRKIPFYHQEYFLITCFISIAYKFISNMFDIFLYI